MPFHNLAQLYLLKLCMQIPCLWRLFIVLRLPTFKSALTYYSFCLKSSNTWPSRLSCDFLCESKPYSPRCCKWLQQRALRSQLPSVFSTTEERKFTQSCGPFPGNPHPIMKVGLHKVEVALPQLGTALKGCSPFTIPHWTSSETVLPLSLPSPSAHSCFSPFSSKSIHGKCPAHKSPCQALLPRKPSL